LFSDIIDFKRLHVISEFEIEGRCELSQKASSQFRSSYFDFGRNNAQKFRINRKDWPKLRLKKIDRKVDIAQIKVKENEGILHLRYTLSGIDRDVIDLSLELYSEGDVINSSHINILIDPRNLAGCSPPGQDPLVRLINSANPRGLNFNLRSVKKIFRVGKDPVQFEIATNQQLYVYCLSMGKDGTSRIAYPWDKNQLNNPWRSGERRIYPDDFQLQQIVLQREASELFGCYASPSRLPEALENRWINAHSFNEGGKGENGELRFDETSQLLGWLNNTPNVGSAYTWLRAKR